MEKLIITAAICGAEVTKKMNPAVPYTIEEIVRETKSAYDAGAAVIHLHVRWDDGTPTQDKGRYKEAVDAIMEVCPDVIILPSTGGAVGMTATERMQPLELMPEIATLDCGSCNFGGDDVFINTENMNIEFAMKMKELGVKPELECFEKGMIDNALKLVKKGLVNHPLHFNIVLGVNGAMAATPRDLVYMVESLPEDSTWTGTGIGKYEFDIAAMSIVMGGNVRVGFEDNLYMESGVLAKNNGELVAKVAKLAGILKREIATPADARRILGLKQ